MAASAGTSLIVDAEAPQRGPSEGDIAMTTASAQRTSLESKIRLLLLLGDTQRSALYTEPQLKELWNGLESASTEIGKTIKKYKEHETVSFCMKTNWKDKLEKTTLAYAEPFNSGEEGNARKFQNVCPLREAISNVRAERVDLREEHQGEVASNKLQRLQVDQNKLLRKELLLLQNFSDEPVMDEECGNTYQETLRRREKNLVKVSSVAINDTGGALQGSECAHRFSGSFAKKQLEAAVSNAWLLKEFSTLKETAMANGCASYLVGNLHVGGHCLTVGVYLKKRGYSLSLHMHIEMQSGIEPTSWPVKEAIRFRLIHPKKREDCTLEANGEGSMTLCKSDPEAYTDGCTYISKKYFSLRDIEDSGYVRNDALKFIVEVV